MFVADGKAGLRVIDVCNPAAPSEVAFLDTPGFAGGLDIKGDFAYVTDGDAGLRITDIGDFR